VESLGEVYFYNSYNSVEDDPKLYTIHTKQCTCGVQFVDCPFWKSVNDTLPHEVVIVRKSSLADTLKIAWNMIAPVPRKMIFRVGAGDDRLLFRSAEIVLREQGSACRYLLDSSKDPRRLVRLVQMFGPDRIKVIHLVRDGRAFVASYNSRKKTRVKEWGLRPENFLVSAAKWVGVNMFTYFYLKKNHVDSLHISYDLFCQNPTRHLQKLNERFGINIPEDYIATINSNTYHNVHGNLMKIKRLHSIKYDDSWKQHLSLPKRVILSLLLYPFNKLLVEHDGVNDDLVNS